MSLLSDYGDPPQARGPRHAGETGGASHAFWSRGSHAEPDPRRMNGKSVILWRSTKSVTCEATTPVMGGLMRKRVTILSSTIAAAATLALGLQAAPALAVSADACSLISKAKVESILGLGHVEWRDRPAHLYPDESDGMSHATCYGTAYSGSTPFTLAQKKRKITEGKAAAFGWEIYGPDMGAPAEDLEKWERPNGGYEDVTKGITNDPVATSRVSSTPPTTTGASSRCPRSAPKPTSASRPKWAACSPECAPPEERGRPRATSRCSRRRSSRARTCPRSRKS